VVQAGLGEQCDDGGFIDGDGCDSNCTVTTCGNGVRTAGEECDDHNTIAGDCCSSACRVEAAGAPCFDGNVCDGTGRCDGSGSCEPETGTPLDCDDGKPQTFDFCDALHGCRQCTGECNRDGEVTVDELLTMVRIALGAAAVSECPAGDGNQDGTITIGEIVAAVKFALDGCAGG
jgi:cysteine-rich repeat protein